MNKLLRMVLCLSLVWVTGFGQVDEILQLKEKIIDLQNEGELGFRHFNLCKKIISFGAYVPLQEPVLEKNDTLLIYYEPENVFTNRKDGIYEIWYTQDMILLDASGKPIISREDILNFRHSSQSPVLDLYAQNSINLQGKLPPGSYTFKAVLKDRLGDKTAVHTIDFTVK